MKATLFGVLNGQRDLRHKLNIVAGTAAAFEARGNFTYGRLRTARAADISILPAPSRAFQLAGRSPFIAAVDTATGSGGLSRRMRPLPAAQPSRALESR